MDATLLIWETLKDDPNAQDFLTQIDEATTDAEIKDGMKKAIVYLDNNGKQSVAKVVREKTQGFLK